MAHSGGGGSHSGSSHRGSHSSGPTRGGTRPYSGARRYCYYRRGRARYFYSDRPYTEQEFRDRQKGLRMFGIVWSIFLGIFLALFLLANWPDRGPFGPLDTSQLEKNEPAIYDMAEMMTSDEEWELYDYLCGFVKDTGVVPVVITNPERYLDGKLADESLELYYSNFEDEQHWLIYYVGEDFLREDEWEWELTCGDDALKVLDSGQEDRFTRVFHENLDDHTMAFSDAVMSALGTLEPDMRQGAMGWGEFIFNGTFTFLLFLLGPYLIILANRKLKRPLEGDDLGHVEAYVVSENAPQARCPVCGASYTKGDTRKCPLCGGRL